MDSSTPDPELDRLRRAAFGRDATPADLEALREYEAARSAPVAASSEPASGSKPAAHPAESDPIAAPARVDDPRDDETSSATSPTGDTTEVTDIEHPGTRDTEPHDPRLDSADDEAPPAARSPRRARLIAAVALAALVALTAGVAIGSALPREPQLDSAFDTMLREGEWAAFPLEQVTGNRGETSVFTTMLIQYRIGTTPDGDVLNVVAQRSLPVGEDLNAGDLVCLYVNSSAGAELASCTAWDDFRESDTLGGSAIGWDITWGPGAGDPVVVEDAPEAEGS